MESILFKNNKTGDLYVQLEVVTCATNATDGKSEVIYMNMKGKRFSRELEEFNIKFTKVDPSKLIFKREK